MGSPTGKTSPVRRLRAVFGCTYEALAIYRMALGVMLTIELVTRFRYLHPFYSDEGTLPLRLLLPKIDWLYKAVCLHTHLHELWQIQAVLGIQVLAAVLFTIGFQTKIMTILSWYLYLSLTLRNTWLNFILDRYFHYLLFYAMFLPCDQVWSVRSWWNKQESPPQLVISAGTIAVKCLVFWIYLDAGGGKYMDPLQGWTYHAKPLPALDTYTRHTVFARYLYALMGPEGLRAMTPTVVWVELLAAPMAMLGSFLGMSAIVNTAVCLICQLHVGIALCMNNAVLLSFVAIAAWAVYLPVGWEKIPATPPNSNSTTASSIFSTVIILGMIAGNIWFAFNSDSCDQVIFYSTIFHCRWNVFIGAEEYVTWEIAPGLLADNSIVDVWGRKDEVDWRLPGAGAPCTSTARPGRWRSYPYLAELDGEDGVVLWSYLCHQWDRENNVDRFPGRKLVKFNFFMLQADVLPNMGFSATRKRLIHTHECVKSDNATEETTLSDETEPEAENEDTIEEEANTTQEEQEAPPPESKDVPNEVTTEADEAVNSEQSTGTGGVAEESSAAPEVEEEFPAAEAEAVDSAQPTPVDLGSEEIEETVSDENPSPEVGHEHEARDEL